MKKLLFSIAALSFVFSFAVAQVLAAAPMPVSGITQARELKVKLLGIKKTQAAVKSKIQRNISQARSEIKQIKRKRAAVKKVRTAVKKTAGKTVK